MRDLPPSYHLAKNWAASEQLSYHESVLRTVRRTKELVRTHNLTVEDVAKLSPAFWDLHADPIAHLDSAVGTLATIQVNLVAGTLSRYIRDKPSLIPLIKKILSYDIMGQFCLTEVKHGLDAKNIETTATLLPDGKFELHTPHPGAAKFMPPTNPCDVPCIAIVFANLMVAGKNHGFRPFLVPLNDGQTMYSGITARLLPPRGGSMPLNHCVTSFDKVKLPAGALLGDIAKDTSHASFLRTIWRVAVGTLALGGMTMACLEIAPYIVARYSQRRTVAGPSGKRVPVLSFRTQHGPVLTALAQGFVVREFWKRCTALFSEGTADYRILHACATIFKVTTAQHVQAANLELSERCGAQGLFAHNQIVEMHANMRGVQIAEGDTLVISIRLASELLQEMYELPPSTHPDSMLARHERAILDEHKVLLHQFGHHRIEEFNRLFLPDCEKTVAAIGHRMAYDAALDAGLDSSITDVYLASAVKLDQAWYCEQAGFSRLDQAKSEDKALSAALPYLDEWLEAVNIEAYVKAPITSDSRWQDFVDTLEMYVHIKPTHALVERVQSRL